jgi:hypothetical protein
MTTAQFDEARREAASWTPLPPPEVMVIDIALSGAVTEPAKQ